MPAVVVQVLKAGVAVKRTVKAAIVAVLVGGAVFAAWEVLHWLTHVYESDGRIRSELTRISPVVNAKIVDLPVPEGGRVAAGDLLVQFDDTGIRLELEALRTELALKGAERDRLLAEQRAAEAELESGLATSQQKIRAVEQEFLSVGERLELSEANLARMTYLLERNLVSEDRFSQEKDRSLALRGEADVVEARVAVARQEFREIQATRARIDVIVEMIRVAGLEEERIRDRIRAAGAERDDRRILAPIAGVISRIYHHVGEYVEDGTTIMMLHDPERFWIEAHVAETRLRHVEVGQPVEISFEAYPFRTFHGMVRGIGTVTATEMNVEMPSNGRGFGSDLARIPVSISIDDPPPNLAPGMRARVNIVIRTLFPDR